MLGRLAYQFDDTTIWTYLVFLFFSIVSYTSYSGIIGSALMGDKYEFYFDIFWINAITQLLTTYSDWFWLVYACVPGYFVMKCCKYFMMWAENTGKGEEEEEIDPKLKKKMERKANKVKYIR